jgi:hypothetical protein
MQKEIVSVLKSIAVVVAGVMVADLITKKFSSASILAPKRVDE